MKILYVTANVLGDSGANAAEIFPRLAAISREIEQVFVADYSRNKNFVKERQLADFLRLRTRHRPLVNAFRNALRIAKKSKDNDVDVIHVFYRQANIPLVIFLRLALIALWCRATIIVDHRSVNLARGRRATIKKLANMLMQVFAHRLAGNPWAVETNHFFTFKPKDIIDLGYDNLHLPEGNAMPPPPGPCRNIWFIGTLAPRNRKTEFLIDVFNAINSKTCGQGDIEIHIAGLARRDQVEALRANPLVKYYGRIPRGKLYELLQSKPGVGAAFMNKEFHAFAPSLKLCEYAIMRFTIVASDTPGHRMQVERMNLPEVVFAEEDVNEWAEKLIVAAEDMRELAPDWLDADLWSYESVFQRQVIGLYERICDRA
jgi:hypothetical protein